MLSSLEGFSNKFWLDQDGETRGSLACYPMSTVYPLDALVISMGAMYDIRNNHCYDIRTCQKIGIRFPVARVIRVEVGSGAASKCLGRLERSRIDRF